MNKIFLIISREYLTRVKKKSFIIMSILGPILFASMFIIPIWLSTKENDEVKRIAVLDESMEFVKMLPESKSIKFDYVGGRSLNSFKMALKDSTNWDALLYIPPIVAYSPSSIQLISYNQISYHITNQISTAIENILRDKKLRAYGIQNIDQILESTKTKVNIQTITISGSGEKESDIGINMALGYIFGLMIYMFIFLFGAQVMRGVIEEKTNRIVEVMISSVKPFQLMMGKVLGIALVVLTQISFWIILTVVLITLGKAVFLPNFDMAKAQTTSQSVMTPGSGMSVAQTASPAVNMSDAEKAFMKLSAINFVKIVGWFIFFFIGGYLLYGSLFAAIGSVVDADSDTQQFMLPVTIPLILGLFVMIYTLNNHDSSIAFWFSMIPLTSPIVMMARVVFDAPDTEIFISAVILILSFIGSIWMAGKIYRTGILLYGKKVTYKEIFRWLKYKN